MTEADLAEFDVIVIGAGPTGETARKRNYMTSDRDDSGQIPWLESKDTALVRGTGRLAGERTVEGSEWLLSREEPFACDEVRAAFEADGISVLTGVAMNGLAREGVGGPVTATLADGRTLVADEILVAVGRRPATGDLGLDLVGLATGSPVKVDNALRSVGADGASSPWLYAVGDCNGRALLTHVGKHQARIAADVILGKDVGVAGAYTLGHGVKGTSFLGATLTGPASPSCCTQRPWPSPARCRCSGSGTPSRPSRRSARSGCGCWRRTGCDPRRVMTSLVREGRVHSDA